MRKLLWVSLPSVLLFSVLFISGCGGVPRLSITTTSLMNGTVTTAYSQKLQAMGGVPPYVWTMPSGTLPAGLTMDPTGVISGTPSAPSTANFTAQVSDSARQPHTASANLSIAVVVGPLSVTTTSLPNGAVDTAYRQNLQATGGLPPYTWSVTAGSLPEVLALNSSAGTVRGATIKAGTSNFTVQVADSETPAKTAPQALSVTVTTASSPDDSKLNGHYAFLFSGFDDATGSQVAVAGSFTADGGGNIAGGVEDVNGPGGPSLDVPFTGTYSIDTDNRGFFTIDTASGTKTYAFVVGSISGGVAQKARFIEFDDTTGTNGQRGSGVMRLQDATAFAIGSITGPYAFGFVGQDAAGNRKAIVGTFTADGAGTIPSGLADQSVAGTVTNPSLTGTYTAPSSTNGRATMMLSLSGSSLNQSVYVVSAKELLAMSTDTFSTDGLTSGTDLSQTSTSFSNSSLNAPTVFYDVGGCAEIGLASGNGSGTLSVTNDSCAAESVFTATYSVASNGRVTISGWLNSGSPQRICYLVDTNKAFFLDTGARVGFGFLEPQSAAPAGGFSNASLSGTFPANTAAPAVGPDPNASGLATLGGTSNFSMTQDISSTSGLSLDQVTTGTYSIAANGRGIVTNLATSSSTVALLVGIFGGLLALLARARRSRPRLRLASAMLLLVGAIAVVSLGCPFHPNLVFYIISPTKAVMIQEGLGGTSTTGTVTIIGQ